MFTQNTTIRVSIEKIDENVKVRILINPHINPYTNPIKNTIGIVHKFFIFVVFCGRPLTQTDMCKN